MQGWKSWTGLVAIVLGIGLKMLGVGECSTEELAAATCVPADTIVASLMSALDQILVAGGIALNAIGVAHKQIREKRLLAQLPTSAPPSS